MRSLCCVVSQMIRRSLTSGNDRKEESRNAMMKRPGPPRETANALIHSTTPAISPKCRLESALATTTPPLARSGPAAEATRGSGADTGRRDSLPSRRSSRAARRRSTTHARPRARALRRARPPRGRAAHPRQPDARLAADRCRLAAPPPRPEHAAGPGGRVVPDGRVGDRDLGRVDGRRRLGTGVAHHRTHRIDRRRDSPAPRCSSPTRTCSTCRARR